MSDLDKSLKRLSKQLDAIGAMDMTNALMAAGLVLQGEAQKRSPVDSGANRASASTEVKGDSVEVSFNMGYSAYLELGTKNMPAQPYIRPAIDEEEDKILAAAAKQLRQDIKGVANVV